MENSYMKIMKALFYITNPIKKKIIKTLCIVHICICKQSLNILLNAGYKDEFEFFIRYMASIKEGIVWADADYKSSNHFYHYKMGKGLYGFSNALTEFKKYHNCARGYIEGGDYKKGMFYFGVCLHLIQDTTVPQHVNNQLFNKHRKFEKWIISKVKIGFYKFETCKEIIRYENADEYIKSNAVKANEIYLRYHSIYNTEERYYNIASECIMLAEMTTCGFMLDFYQEIKTAEHMA